MALGDNQTPYLHLNLGTDEVKNRNWAVLDRRIYDVARGLFANIPAGGDLLGFYPDPVIAPGAVTIAKLSAPNAAPGRILAVLPDGTMAWQPAPSIANVPAGGSLAGFYPNPTIAAGAVGQNELQSAIVVRLPPTPTMPADANKVLSVTPGTGALVWTTPAAAVGAQWTDLPAHSTYKPTTLARSLELDPDRSIYFGDPTAGSAPSSIVNSGSNIILSAVSGGTAFVQGSNAGTVLGAGPTTGTCNKDWLVTGGMQVGQFIGASPANGSLQFFASQLQLRVAGAWQNVYPVAYTSITGTPTSLPPSGPAGGSVLSGTYPNPTMAANAVMSANITDLNVTGNKIAPGAVTTDKISPSPAIPGDVGKFITVGAGGVFAYVADAPSDSNLYGRQNGAWAIASGGGGGGSGTTLTFWPDTFSPTPAQGAVVPSNCGMAFLANATGTITAIQFWKIAADTGPHVGTVWRESDQTQLGSVTFSGETASGWQTANLPTPVAITAGTRYRVAVSRTVAWADSGIGGFTGLSLPVGNMDANSVYATSLSAYPAVTNSNHTFYVDVLVNSTNALGAAGGDLQGFYPNPTLVAAQKNLWQATATALTPLDPTKQLSVPGPPSTAADNATILMGSRTQKGRLAALPGLDWVGLSANRRYTGSAWVRDDTAQPSWTLALATASDTTLAYENATGTASTPFRVGGVDGKTYCTLADLSVTRAMMAADSARRGGPPGAPVPLNTTYTSAGGAAIVCTTASYTTKGGAVLLAFVFGAHYSGSATANTYYLDWRRDGVVQRNYRYDVASAAGAGLYFVPTPGFVEWDFPSAAAHTWSVGITVVNANGSVITSADNAGLLEAMEFC